LGYRIYRAWILLRGFVVFNCVYNEVDSHITFRDHSHTHAINPTISQLKTSAQGQDGIGYQAVRLWAKMGSWGLCYLTNLLITQGLPKELKTAKVVVIGKPGEKDMSNLKSYRCISLLSNVAKLTEKAVAQYVTLEGKVHGWWHPYQFGSRQGRNTTDALMWLKAVVEKHQKEKMNTALIMSDVAAAFPGTRPSTVHLSPIGRPKNLSMDSRLAL
jgi:hypothetical protein